jgi:hypothetical protein
MVHAIAARWMEVAVLATELGRISALTPIIVFTLSLDGEMLISVEYGSVVPLRFVNKYQAEDIYSIPLGIYWITKEWVSKAAESHECIIIFAPHLHAVGVFPSIRRTPCHTIRQFSEANAARGNAEYHEGHHGDTMPPKRKI